MATVLSDHYSFEGVDDASADLILELQLADIDSLQSEFRGKQREGELTDVEYALLLMQQNLDCIREIISDRRMTQSIADAVEHDSHLVAAVVLEEAAACRDHDLAHHIDSNNNVDEIEPQEERISDELLSKLAGAYISEKAGSTILNYHEEDVYEAGPSSSQTEVIGDEMVKYRCEACQEYKRYFEVTAGPCGHHYCRDCIQELFQAALTDESLFPPRCCRQPITIDSVSIFLTKTLRQSFEEKKIEFSTPNRTYCCNPTCSAFISLDEIYNDAGTCADCGTVTCTICKSPGHAGECPQDAALKAVVDLANEQKWQRCYNCRRVVELQHGCNHITCRCGGEFCYVCGLQWKTCRCDQWDEQNLLLRANVIVDREPEIEGIENRALRVERAAQMLQGRHNCRHFVWTYVAGSHPCEECHYRLPNYIFECRQCQIRACNRCRRNRL